MRNSNGSNVSLDGNHSKKVNSSLLVESKIPNPLNTSESEFLDFVKFHGIEVFVSSLKMIHDFALYHTDLCFVTEEKNALFNLKILWEGLEQMVKS